MAEDRARQERARSLGQLVAKAWTDEAFKQRLLADPKAVLSEQGIEVPADLEVRVVEDTERVVYIVLPPKPGEGELTEEQLGSVAAGAAWAGVSSCCIHLRQ